MTREEHNEFWGVNRQPHERVECGTCGYGEISQYDPLCGMCWLGYEHTWERHDQLLAGKERPKPIKKEPAL